MTTPGMTRHCFVMIATLTVVLALTGCVEDPEEPVVAIQIVAKKADTGTALVGATVVLETALGVFYGTTDSNGSWTVKADTAGHTAHFTVVAEVDDYHYYYWSTVENGYPTGWDFSANRTATVTVPNILARNQTGPCHT